ncbi:MAG: deoxyguanosinetriphosphate triphosphohydrolase family protein [Promethearchaeota archaeon]
MSFKGKFNELIRKTRKIKNRQEKKYLKKYATYSKNAIRMPDYGQPTIRSPFCRDSDRILHSFSFSRFSDKTQVFFWIESDIFQHRLLHVHLVSKISRYIAQILGLNEDLAESIALGHDIGHCPFGHDGEIFINKLCGKSNIGRFRHNYESAWFLQNIELQNLTLQTLDGIITHNGEIQERKIIPDRSSLSWETLNYEMKMLLNNQQNPNPKPKTMEGTLVRFADVISYISRDLRDAQNLSVIGFKDIPINVKNVLGNSNRAIINTLITDLIENSLGKDYISYSEVVSTALRELYGFNLKHIYLHEKKIKAHKFLEQAFSELWNQFLDDLEHERKESEIFKDHLEFNLNEIKTRYPEIKKLEDYPYYKENISKPNIIVRDFLAGMTDSYFLKSVNKYAPELEFKREIIN